MLTASDKRTSPLPVSLLPLVVFSRRNADVYDALAVGEIGEIMRMVRSYTPSESKAGDVVLKSNMMRGKIRHDLLHTVRGVSSSTDEIFHDASRCKSFVASFHALVTYPEHQR